MRPAWDYELLVRLWLDGLSIVEIAKKLETTPGNVGARVAWLRHRGVHLPGRRRAAVDVAALNALIAGGETKRKRK